MLAIRRKTALKNIKKLVKKFKTKIIILSVIVAYIIFIINPSDKLI
jgi:hypothetical protein